MHIRTSVDEEELDRLIRGSGYGDVLLRALNFFEKGDFKRGHENIRSLVNDKVPEALFLAALFSRDDETEQEFELRHVEYLRAAAQMNVALAVYSLGIYYDIGEIVDRDERKALKYFEMAAKLGHPRSKYLYGVCAYYGTGGILENKQLGYAWIKDSAEQGEEDAIELLYSISDPEG